MTFIKPLFVIAACSLLLPVHSLAADVTSKIDAVMPKVVEWRRDFHQHPELSNQEFRTAKIVADHLRSLGMEVETEVAHTGVVGTLRGGDGTALLRYLRERIKKRRLVSETKWTRRVKRGDARGGRARTRRRGTAPRSPSATSGWAKEGSASSIRAREGCSARNGPCSGLAIKRHVAAF